MQVRGQRRPLRTPPHPLLLNAALGRDLIGLRSPTRRTSLRPLPEAFAGSIRELGQDQPRITSAGPRSAQRWGWGWGSTASGSSSGVAAAPK